MKVHGWFSSDLRPKLAITREKELGKQDLDDESKEALVFRLKEAVMIECPSVMFQRYHCTRMNVGLFLGNVSIDNYSYLICNKYHDLRTSRR